MQLIGQPSSQLCDSKQKINFKDMEKEAALAVEFAGNSKPAGVPADRAFEETATATTEPGRP